MQMVYGVVGRQSKCIPWPFRCNHPFLRDLAHGRAPRGKAVLVIEPLQFLGCIVRIV
jgi:hypothetical protein